MIRLRYGRGFVDFSIPEKWLVRQIEIERKKPILSLEEKLIDKLENPVGERPFSVWIKDFEKVLVIVPDITRYAGVCLILPLIYRKYLKGKDVTILFALGNHRKHSESEKMEILGEEIYKSVPSKDHDCYDDRELTFFGYTSSKVPVYLNRLVRICDCLVVFGSINFHYLAGFGGGRKALIPGIAGYETIIGVHRTVFKEKGKHELARPGILDGNPMHEEIISGLKLIEKPMFLINTVVEEKDIVAIFCGNIEKAHKRGCEWYLKEYSFEVEKKADVIIVSSGGYPKDINFIQTHKSMEHAIGGLKKDGYLITVGACEDGIGNEHFLKFFEYGGIDEMEKAVRGSDKVYSQTAYATRLKSEYCQIVLVSELSEESVVKMGIIPKRTVDEAIKLIDDGREKLCYIIPDGSQTLLLYGGGKNGV
ncbi:MAG: nickel-dependent lactate racemase [Desulfobacterota bacterium]|nr:nickel-dependent lactate racemase [Thermodesulfobacteriota bacterium]MDW8001519.1 nickel-dependent lactate racemase [Deltaproteobacteria bacterium]